ncbi:MAG: N-methyl-L-tryptophan oxidase [Thermomicrobiales bacterium]
MTATYEAIVVGLGAMGSAATYQMATRGRRVLGIEMFQPGHDQGSSHGYHRMIRKSSLSLDGYVPLADRSFALWHQVEAESGKTLLEVTGEVWLVDLVLNPGLRPGIDRSIAHGFREELDERQLGERFPGFRLAAGLTALYEADAGFLHCEEGILTHLALAERNGATIHTGEEVTSWQSAGTGVRVETSAGSYLTDRLIITTGPWAAELLGDLALPFQVQRRVNGYFRPSRPDRWSREHGAPDFMLDVAEGSFYGMPDVADIGLKIGLSAGEGTTARSIRRTIEDEEIDDLRRVLDRYMPGASGSELRRITCMCTYTVDMHFIIDRHPRHDAVIFGCGFSGRGYKFAPVVGEILADLAVDGATSHDVAFLSAARFAASVAAD